jgi:NADH-quinone oxidoreductase subunit L
MSQTLSVSTLLAIPLAPLVGALGAGILGTKFGGNALGRRMCHSLTIFGVLLSFVVGFSAQECGP